MTTDLDAAAQQWKEQGYCIVSGLADPALLQQCTDFLHAKWDTVDKCGKDFGSNGECEFPCGEVIDKLTVEENMIAFVRRLLETEEIQLEQSDAWSKAGRPTEMARVKDATNQLADYNVTDGVFSNQDQRVHMDYGNHTFLHPGDWYKPESVAAIVYFHDTSVTGGGTGVVPREGEGDELYDQPYIKMPGYAGHPFFNNKYSTEDYFKKSHPEIAEFRQKLYARERIPHYKMWDILFYRLDTWHRGTPLKPNAIRTVLSLAWRRTDAYWYCTYNPGFAKKNYYGVLEKLFTAMSPLQRGTLGVPLPGHPYWSPRSIAMLTARYPGIDTQPYTDAIKK